MVPTHISFEYITQNHYLYLLCYFSRVFWAHFLTKNINTKFPNWQVFTRNRTSWAKIWLTYIAIKMCQIYSQVLKMILKMKFHIHIMSLFELATFVNKLKRILFAFTCVQPPHRTHKKVSQQNFIIIFCCHWNFFSFQSNKCVCIPRCVSSSNCQDLMMNTNTNWWWKKFEACSWESLAVY